MKKVLHYLGGDEKRFSYGFGGVPMKIVATALAMTVALAAASARAQTTPQPASFAPVERAEQCPADRSPIMILGTYHMDNPGLDARNIEADDVLSARRQGEVVGLVAGLAGFRPTKIMLEAAYADRAAYQQHYRNYLAGTYKLTRNEIDQVGLRLAKQLGHQNVYPIDFPMFMSGQSYDELDFSERARAPAPASPPAAPAPPPEPSEADRRLRASTIAEFLIWMNDPAQWRPDHLGYMRMFNPEPGNISIYAATDRLTNWYRRNFRMWANLVRVTERPRDRPLLIVGAGHLAILRQLAQDTPGFCLVEPRHYLQTRRGSASPQG
jgi:hypothetical protein